MARVIAGSFGSTDTGSLYLEANVFGIMKTVDDKIMTGIERHRRRPAGDPLRVKALGTTPRVKQMTSFTTNVGNSVRTINRNVMVSSRGDA